MRTNTKFVLLAVSIILVALAGFYVVKINTAVAPSDGITDISIETSSPLVKLTSPRPNDEITNPLVVIGEARGNWYFEASFPVRLLDSNGKEIAVTPAQAKGDWMTTDFVPFRAELVFISPNTKEGTLVLEKDNPSGLPEHADEVRIPIRFKDPKDINNANITSGIRGMVTIGPTCPVMRNPPDPTCADKPYQAQFKITKKGSLFSKTVSSGSDGVINVELVPGEYIISSLQKNIMPSFSTVEFTVMEGKITELTLQFDSGIR